MPAATLPRFRTYRAEVIAVHHFGPHFVRVTFGGAGLAEFECEGVAPKIKVWIPAPGDTLPLTGPFDAARERALMRTYTVREFRAAQGEVDIDFVIHADGPAGRWAASATPGQALLLSQASGYPPVAGERILFVGDPSSLPAIMTALPTSPGAPAQLTHGTARVLLAVDSADEVFELETPAASIAHWLVTAGNAGVVETAVREHIAEFKPDYVWSAGEAGVLKPLRRYLRGEVGFGKESSHIVGYWRRDSTADAYDSETIARATELVNAGLELTRQDMDELSLSA